MMEVKLNWIRFLFIEMIMSSCLWEGSLGLDKSHQPAVEHIEETYVCSDAYNRSCCTEDEFQCNDGTCIPAVNLCDSKSYSYRILSADTPSTVLKADCADGSDELGCSTTSCSSRNPPCQQSCTDLPRNRSRCSCFDGFSAKSLPPHSVCEDIDECKLGTHLCSQVCVNTKGSYKCACLDGFHQDPRSQNGSCKAQGEGALILFNSHSWIYAYDVESEQTYRFVSSGRVSSMDYDPVSNMIYWFNQHHYMLSRSYINGKIGNKYTAGEVQRLCVTDNINMRKRKGITVDWTVGNLYWIYNDMYYNDVTSSIMVSRLDGVVAKAIIYNNNSTISSFVLHPSRASIYWTTMGKHAEIGTSNMDGSGRRSFFSLRGQHPRALTLDQGNERLYWLDSKTSCIYSTNKDAAGLIKILKTNEDEVPLSMDVFEDYLYWVTKGSGQLVRFNKFGKDLMEVLVEELDDETSVKVYHKRKNKDYFKIGPENLREKCRECSDLCVRVDRGYECMVTYGQESELRKQCREYDHVQFNRPSKCDCLNWKRICDPSAPHHACRCDPTCDHDPRGRSGHRKTHGYRHSVKRVILTVLGIIVLIVIVSCLAFSLCKRQHKVKRNRCIQMEEVSC